MGVIPVSFSKEEEDLEYEIRHRAKFGKSAWMKEAAQMRIEAEDKAKRKSETESINSCIGFTDF